MNCTVIHKNPMNLFNVGLYHREADTKLCTCTGRGARSHASRKEKGRKKENRRESYRILPMEKKCGQRDRRDSEQTTLEWLKWEATQENTGYREGM